MDPYLHILGLYQLAIMEDCQQDKSLLIVLVDRWRPETSTFYLSVGETTVTLEDVCCLWELPIRGICYFYILFHILFFNYPLKFTNLIFKYKNIKKSIPGVIEDEWSGILKILLGLNADPYSYNDITNNPWLFKIRNKEKENEYVQFLTYNIRLACLWRHFRELSVYSKDETAQWYNFYYN
jgi:Plant mobile domain